MFNPSHPGEVFYGFFIEGHDRSIGSVAQHLGISTTLLQEFIDGERSVTVDLSLRLSKAFGTTAGYWLGMQSDYDNWHLANQPYEIDVQPFRQIGR